MIWKVATGGAFLAGGAFLEQQAVVGVVLVVAVLVLAVLVLFKVAGFVWEETENQGIRRRELKIKYRRREPE